MTLQDFKNKYLGKQVEYHSYGGSASHFQCVDLINAYLTEVLNLSPIIGTDAKDFGKRYDAEELLWIANTPAGVPQVGDIIVWSGNVGGGAGHVGIFLNGNTTSFQSLDQNWSKTKFVTLETHNYKNVSGWLRPIKAVTPPMNDDLQECLRLHGQLMKEINEQLKPTIKELEQMVDEKQATIKAFEEFRNKLAENLAVENQTTAIIGAIERLLTIESQKAKLEAENMLLKEQLEGMQSAEPRVQELTEANLELSRINEALMEEVELLKKRKTIDRFTPQELFVGWINSLFRRK